MITTANRDYSSYVLGVKIIDKEHGLILSALNNLKNSQFTHEQKELFFHELVNAAATHLATEGMLMLSHSYPHKESHDIANLALIRATVKLSPSSTVEEIDTVVNLFLSHSDTHDRLMVDFMQKNHRRRKSD